MNLTASCADIALLDVNAKKMDIGVVLMNDPELIDELLEGLPDLVTSEEIAKLMRVTPNTILKWTRDMGLRHIAVGSRLKRVRKSDLREILINSDQQQDHEVQEGE